MVAGVGVSRDYVLPVAPLIYASEVGCETG
jgi:hypothetical protein